jgi:hypothetical protein
MKSTLLIFSLLFSFCFFSKAQFKQIAASPEFDEPISEYSTFILMKNGNLVFTEVGFKDSIRTRVYNSTHQEIAVTSYAMTSPAKRTYLALTKAFEIDGEVVLFINTEEEKARVIYRVRVDPASGKVKKEEKIFELKPLPKKELYTLDWGAFHVNKSAESDDYAVVFCNNFRSEKIKKIEIVQFNKDHAETSRASYETAEYEALSFRGIEVIDRERVALLLLTYTYNSGDERLKMLLALKKRGSSALSINMLKFPADRKPEKAILHYNNYSNKIIVAAWLGGYPEGQYVGFYNSESGKAEKSVDFNFTEAIFEKIRDIHGKKFIFLGKPVMVLTGKTEGFSIVYEEDEDVFTQGSTGTWFHHYTTDIIVADFDKNAKLLSNYLVPKKFLLNASTSLSYGGGFGNQYRTYTYMKGVGKDYLFINDTRVNIDRLEKNKDPKQVSVVNDCDAFYFQLTGKEPIPSRKYLYGETREKEEHIQSPFGVSAYDKENDIFITLRLNRDPKKRTNTTNVVWLKPQ